MTKRKIKSKTKKLKISACYIVKNSAEDLKISIQSLKHAVDEIIVVDTGSTDSTVEVAKSFGAKIFFREWDDDFSAPRNLAISKATGDWIIFLDSDEFFSEETKSNIPCVIKGAEKFKADCLLILLVNIDKDTTDKILGSPTYTARIFKNQPGLHYEGKIHEQPMINNENFLKVFPVEKETLKIYHTGYIEIMGKSKARRNLKILLSELNETNNPKRLYSYIAQSYYVLEDWENAEKFARIDIDSGKISSTVSFRVLFSILSKKPERFAEFEKFISMAVKNFPEFPEFTVNLAECQAMRGDFQKAIETMRSAVRKFKNYVETKSIEQTYFNQKSLEDAENKIKFWTEKIRLKISACYIVKNSAEDLKISIESLKHAVDEIIVVDTGSTDSTVEVAKSFGAKIFFREWDDDFSAPRNLALSKATGDWIIFLDADEFFSEETKKFLRPAVERAEEFKKTGILIFLVNIDKNSGNKILDTNKIMRIFKNQKDLHYVGKIHEELRVGEDNLTEITVAPQNILTLYHTGYSTSVNKKKAERNLKMLLDELAETNEPQRIYGYIAECYNGLKDFVNAEKFARLNIDSMHGQKKLFATASYRIILNILADDKKRFSEREKFAELAVKDFPELPEFTAELAECYAVRGDFQRAIETMKTAIQKFKNYNSLETMRFNENLAKFAESRIDLWTKKIRG